jgi:hypothetical protein
VLDFAASLICQRAKVRDFECPLVIALASLGIKESGWERPGSYTGHLSAILCIANMVLLQCAARTAGAKCERDPDILGELLALKSTYGIRGTGSPLQWALDLRAYGWTIHASVGNPGEVRWDLGRIVFRGNKFTSLQFQAAVHGLLGKTHALLFDTLLFKTSADQLPRVPWEQLLDSPATDGPRACATVVWESAGLGDRGTEWLCSRVKNDPDLRAYFWDADTDAIRPGPALRYVRSIDTFLESVLVLIHFVYGQPARGTELFSALHSSTGEGGRRSICIENGLVCLSIDYSKTGWRPIFRFLPRPVGEILMYYLHFVLPFRTVLARHLRPDAPPCPYLWPRDRLTPGGGRWTSDRLSDLIKRQFQLIGCPHVTLLTYRHIAKALARREVPSCLVGGDDDDGGDEFSSGRTAGQDPAQRFQEVIDSQAGHSGATSQAFYAVDHHALGRFFRGSGMTDREAHYVGSVAWHRFLGFHASGSRRSDADPIQRADDAQTLRLEALKEVDPVALFRKLHGQQARFRGKQEEAVRKILAGHSPLVVVMGTGAGKTECMTVPAASGHGGTGLCITPYKRLNEDLLLRCRRLNIACAIWRQDEPAPHDVSLVFATPESFDNAFFRSFVEQCVRRRTLDRIYIDECHELLNSFRVGFAFLGDKLDRSVQVVCLSGTLRPADEAPLLRSLGLDPSFGTTIRQPTTKKNMRYSAVCVKRVPGIPKLAEVLGRDAAAFWAEAGNGGKLQIGFCTSVRQAEELAALSPEVAGSYHGRLSEEDGDEVLRQFRSGRRPLLFATSAAQSGIDFENVGRSFQVGKPADLTEKAQGDGRAGRDGERCESTLYHGPLIDRGKRKPEIDAFAATEGCRRRVMDLLDGTKGRTQCLPDEVPCDRCEADALVGMPEDEAPNGPPLRVAESPTSTVRASRIGGTSPAEARASEEGFPRRRHTQAPSAPPPAHSPPTGATTASSPPSASSGAALPSPGTAPPSSPLPPPRQMPTEDMLSALRRGFVCPSSEPSSPSPGPPPSQSSPSSRRSGPRRPAHP